MLFLLFSIFNLTFAFFSEQKDKQHTNGFDTMNYLQKELRDLIRESPAIFDFLEAHIFDGLWYWDLEEPEEVWINPAFWTILGYDPNEMPHKSEAWQGIVLSEDLERAKGAVARYLKNTAGGRLDEVFRYRHKKGHTVWVHCKGSAFLNVAGQPYRLLCVHTDVTESKQKEHELYLETLYLKSLLDTQTGYICRIDLNGNYTYVNEKLRQDFEFCHKDNTPIGKPAKNSVLKEDFKQLEAAVMELFKNPNKPLQVELRKPHKDGHIANTLWEFLLLKDENGTPIEIQGFGLDYTEEKKAKEHLYKMTQILNDAQAMAQIGAWDKDLVAGEDNWSDVTRAIHEVEADFVPTMENSVVFYKEGENRSKIIQAVEHTLTTGEPFDLEVQLLTAKGRERWVRTIGHATFADGKAVRLSGIIQDIDDKRRNEGQLMQAEKKAVYKSNLLEAVARCNSFFTKEKTWFDALQKSLEVLGKAMEVDRTYFFENTVEDGQLLASQRIEWVKGGISEQIDNPELQNLPFTEVYGDVAEVLLDNQVFEVIVSELPQGATKELLESQDIKTLMFFPLFVGIDFIGFIGFDDCTTEREITPDERNIMQSFVESLGRSILLQQEQNKLKASETKLRNMLNSTKDSIVLISPTYRVLNFNKVANESAMRLYGKTMQLGDDFLVYLMPEVKETFFDFFAKAMEGEQVSSEFRTDVGGRMLWLKYAYLPVYADEGEIIGVSFNIINVNKRREAEEQLKSLLAENQAITKALDNSALVSITDLEGKILKVNQIFCDVSGYSEMELIGSDHNIVNSGKHDKAFWRGMWQTIAKGKAWRAEVCNRAKNGDIYWVDTVINPMYDEHGKIHQYLSIRYLATQRKNAEQKLKDSEAYHRSLIKTIPDLVFVIGKNGVFLDFKAASKDLYTKPEDFLGKNIFDVLPQDVAEKLQKALHKTLENSDLVEFQYSLEITNELRHLNARVIAFGRNKVTAIVTEVTESVNNLKNIQSLLHVKEEQNRRLGNFTHIVSHNLRSHSANLQGLLAMLELETPEIYENEYLRMFRDASDNLSETIHHLNQVLDISNTQDAAWKILNLHEVINANVKNISMLIKEGKISVLNDTPKNVNLHVIPAYLDSIVLNFLTNAVKYRSKERDSFVRFFVEQDGNYTVLKVQDNGLGIDLKKYRSRLFGMYKTFHTHKESKGLGLFITKNQIEAMGGRVEVESEVNIGTTFKIYFLNEKN